jgi:hypothetical protein
MDTWSEELRKDHVGCSILGKEKHDGGIDEDEIFEVIDAPFIGTGWVTNGTMSFNNMLITKDTRSCKKFVARA